VIDIVKVLEIKPASAVVEYVETRAKPKSRKLERRSLAAG
jgi:hypothetical protein